MPGTISFSYDSFIKLLDSLVNNFGSAGESMIFQIGRDYGVHFCQDAMSRLSPNEMELRDLFEYVIQTASKDGWANMEIDDFNPQNGTIHVILKQIVFEPKCTMLLTQGLHFRDHQGAYKHGLHVLLKPVLRPQ
jgi:hypothetical protein